MGFDCYKRDRWDYAFAGVWDGQFSGCTWKMGDCPAPMEGSDCWLFTCKTSTVQCPR